MLNRFKLAMPEPLERRLLLDAGPLVISEFLAVNDSIFPDEDGDYLDWIEIHNPTDTEVTLDGWHLTDSAANLTKWEFPAGVSLPPGDYMVVFATDKDRVDPAANLHTNFKLSGSGEYLALVRPDGTTISHDYAPEFPEQFSDQSFGLTRDVTTLLPDNGSTDRAPLTYHVPELGDAGLGTSWTEFDFDNTGWGGTVGPPPVLITETDTHSVDFVEIQNVSEDPINVDGWFVVVNNADDNSHQDPPDINAFHGIWPLSGVMESGEIRYRQDAPGDDRWPENENIFWRDDSPGWAMLVDDGGRVGDFVVWGYSRPEIDSLAIHVENFDLTAADAWIGDALPQDPDAGAPGGTDYSRQRDVDSDNDSAFDWTTAVATKDVQNPGLDPPFFGLPMTGIGFTADPSDLGGLLRTDVEAAMRGVNSSIWTRIPFNVDEDLAGVDSMRLWMKYDDGFVAYLNGQEIARSNAPASPAWNSAADSSRDDARRTQYEDIDVSAHMGLLQQGPNVLAIHGLNDHVANGEFLILPKIVVTNSDLFDRYMAIPTPDQPNETATAGAGPQFSQPGGTITEPFLLELIPPNPGDVIRYTLNQSVPTENSPLYTVAIPIDGSVQVRARSYPEGMEPSPVVTETYVMLAADMQSFTSQLPLVVVDAFGGGISTGSFRSGYMAIFEPVDDGNPMTVDLTDLTNPRELDTRIGIKIRGSSSAGWAKPHYAVEAWADGQNEDREIRPLGMAKESDWILGSFYQFDRALMRNPLAFELSNQVGRYAVRTRFVEVFLNTGGRELSYSDYVGVYAFMEKIKRDPERVDIRELEPSDLTPPDVTGGYILKIDRRDPGDSGFNVDGLAYNYVEPKERELETAPRTPQRSYITGYINDFHDAAYGPNYADPNTGFRAYIDTESWIDHAWLNILPMNVDAYRLSGYMHKDRNGLLEGGPVWDFDRSMESTDGRDDRWNVWDPVTGDGGTKYFTYGWWDRLFLDDDFGQRWIDRWYELRQDVFSTANIMGIIDSFRDEIGDAAASRNFVKWSNRAPRFGGWTGEISNLKSWLTNRANWIDNQLPALPRFLQAPGVIDPPFPLTLSVPPGTTIYYTLDGSDPRAPGGATRSPTALIYDGTPITLNASTIVTARAWDGSDLYFTQTGPRGGWSAPIKAEFYIDPPAGADNLVITEINYHPFDPTEEELAVDANFVANDFEFIELRNVGNRRILLAGIQFDNGVALEFADNFGNTLDVGSAIVIAGNIAAFEARYGAEIPLAGEYEGLLKNEGEKIAILDRFGQMIFDFRYDDSGDWPGRADGKGATLELIDPAAVPAAEPQRTEFLENGDNWRSSSEYGGTPGAAGTGVLGDVLVNEVLTRTPAGEMLDTIELHNTTSGDINIGGWYLSDSWGWESNELNGNYKKFRIPNPTMIPAGGYRVFDENDFNPSGGVDPEMHPNDFALNGAEGDDVWLMAADPTGKLVRFVDHAEFGAAEQRQSWGLWPNDAGDSVMYPMIAPTIGDDNSGPRIGSIIISEVQYNPNVEPDDEDLEFIEIYNTTGETIDLTEWRIRKGIDFDFAAGFTLGPRQTLVIVPFELTETAKLDAFNAYYNITQPVQMVGGYDGKLNNAGERVQLQRPDDPVPSDDGGPLVIPRLLEDEVRYEPESPWPIEADGGGKSLQRTAVDVWGNTHLNWSTGGEANPSPGTTSLPVDPLVVGRHIFYNNSEFDGNDPDLNPGDDDAIAPDKTALRPGQTASFDNYTSYTGGINGIMVDIHAMPQGAQPHAGDFLFRVGNDNNPDGWSVAPEPSLVDVRPGQGTSGSDRVTIRWDDTTIAKQWLQVTVLPTANTGLLQEDVFYFGNAIGDTGNSTTEAKVNAVDMLGARNNQRNFFNPAPIDFAFDFNRDERVNSTDMLIARNNHTHFLNALKLITVPPSVDGRGPVMPAQRSSLPAAQRSSLPAEQRPSLPAALSEDLLIANGAEVAAQPQHTSSAASNWLDELAQVLGQRRRPAPGTHPDNDAVDRILAVYGE